MKDIKLNEPKGTEYKEKVGYYLKPDKLYSEVAKRRNNEKKENNTPYIVLATLSEMKIDVPYFEQQT